MTSIINYNGQEYQKRTLLSETEGFLLASAVSSAILSPLLLVSKPFINQLKKDEPDNFIYKEKMNEAFDISGLREKGVGIFPAQHLIQENAYKRGTNACFIPNTKEILVNTDKICITVFHEMGHALNALKSKYGVKYLAKMRTPGIAVAGLMEYFAIFARTKPKGAKRNVTDVIEDNCGKIAFAAMLPVVAEEGIASIRGINLAKKTELGKPYLNKMKKLYAKAFATYGAKAALGGLAVFASRKVMDYFTRPKPVENYNESTGTNFLTS